MIKVNIIDLTNVDRNRTMAASSKSNEYNMTNKYNDNVKMTLRAAANVDVHQNCKGHISDCDVV